MGMNETSRFYSAKDIAEICEISKATAYRIIRKWNEELNDMGYCTPKKGYIVKSYADKRLGFNVKF